MIVTIHRGQNQIGGSIIEVSLYTTRIIFDAGFELDKQDQDAPKIEGLFYGKASYDAVIISHYHGDHIGLCDRILPEIPMYIGEAASVLQATISLLLLLSHTSRCETCKSLLGSSAITPLGIFTQE